MDMNRDLPSRALTIHHRLAERYGERLQRSHPDPVEELVSAILSQNTNDRNRDRAFECLRERLPTWEAVRDAPVGEVEEAIRPAGLSRIKAPRIQAVLHRISEERGELSLHFLASLPLEEARQWLTAMDGVGLKTAAIVLLFAFGGRTRIRWRSWSRVGKRLGLIPPATTREKAHTLLEQLLPPEVYYPLHLNLIALGRDICHPRDPDCTSCPLGPCCDYFRS